MKRFILLAFLLLAGFQTRGWAQRFALVDMQYIMSNIPAYERANEQLNQISKKWQSEVQALDNESKAMYKKYQDEAVFLSDKQKKDREQEIVNKEKAAAELKKKYFGPEGELFKKRESLIQPIQDQVYNAVKAVAEKRDLQLVVDRSSQTAGIVYASPVIDVSNEVLDKLGLSRY